MGELRIINLVDDAIESGRSPEEVCADCPELLPEVRRRLKDYRALERQLDAYFPDTTTGDTSSTPSPRGPGQLPPLPDLPGYDILSTLGAGGMGVVFLARHLLLGREVAVKMLLAGPYAAPRERERFQREARALATLRHPNIVSVYDVGESQGRPYFTMEHMEGGSLAAKLTGHPQPHAEAVRIAVALADAVAHAHRHGIIHRDLKPANILLGADGTLKISDFGIARVNQADQTLTLAGDRMGTPSYMAPEQAVGGADAFGPATDVYALGAILYELLTGRPPFRGSTISETHRQLLNEEPAPPRLLNAGVPRDVETICLKCLQKSPARRYASAADLAADLRRFMAGEPIVARPVGPLERSIKWARRRPGPAVAIAAALVALIVLIGVAVGVASTRAVTIADANADIAEAVNYQRSGEWAHARAAIDRAKIRLGTGSFTDLRARVGRIEDDLALVDRLDGIRLLHASTAAGVINDRAAEEAYERAFADAGLGGPGDPPEVVGDLVGASPIAKVLIGALDDWTTCVKDPSVRSWTVLATQRADTDHDPKQWRRQARAASRGNKLLLTRLAHEAPIAEQPLPFLYAFGLKLMRAKVDAIPFLERAQRAHRDDFWLTSLLANALQAAGRNAEALEYYRAALALRPDTMASYYNLARTLGAMGRSEECELLLREAVRLDPIAADATKALGLALCIRDKHAEALEFLLKAYALDAKDPRLLALIALCMAHNERYDEAVEWYRRAMDADPSPSGDKRGVRTEMMDHAQHAAARSVWEIDLAHEPEGTLSDWDGYAELCLFVGDAAAYERARATLLDRFANLEDPNECERTARACLLLPAPPQVLARARALLDRALASEARERTWSYRYFELARALAAYREGDFETARSISEGESARVLVPMPQLVAAMALHRLGRHDEALSRLADAALATDWTTGRASTREAWINHVLRREAEQMIVPELPDILTGGLAAPGANSILAALPLCQSSGRYARWAQLWEQARSSAAQSESLPTHVTSTLVLAAFGAGVDADRSTPAERTRWRAVALPHARALVDRWEADVRDAPDARTTAAVRRGARALSSPLELACVRDSNQLEQLAADERHEWDTLRTRLRTLAIVPPAAAK